MIVPILFPLFVSWLFLKLKIKRIGFTYLVSGGTVLILLLIAFILHILNTDNFDFSAIAVSKASLVGFTGNSVLMIFLASFFQYIFNQTMGLVKKNAN